MLIRTNLRKSAFSTMFLPYYRYKMIRWLDLNIYRTCTCTPTQTFSKTSPGTQHATSLLHFNEEGRPRLRASAVLLPMSCLFPSSTALHLEMKVQLCVSSLPADRWSSGSDQRDVGLLSNAVLMVPCVVGRKRHAVTNRNSSDSPECYIMVPLVEVGSSNPIIARMSTRVPVRVFIC